MPFEVWCAPLRAGGVDLEASMLESKSVFVGGAVRAAVLMGLVGLVGCDGGDAMTSDAAVTSDALVTGDAVVVSDAMTSDAVVVAQEIEIAGTYSDGFATHEIEGDRWTMSGTDFSSGFTLTRVNNDEDWAIAQNDSSNAFSGGLYSRFEWVRVGTDLYFCQAPYDAATEADALSAARPDRSDPATTGCGTFSWSLLTVTP